MKTNNLIKKKDYKSNMKILKHCITIQGSGAVSQVLNLSTWEVPTVSYF